MEDFQGTDRRKMLLKKEPQSYLNNIELRLLVLEGCYFVPINNSKRIHYFKQNSA